MRLHGEVLSVRPVNGQDYSYLRAAVLDRGGEQIYLARVGDDFGPVTAGEVIEAEVSVTPYLDRSGAAALAVRLVSRVSSPAVARPSAVPSGPASSGAGQSSSRAS